MTRKAVRPFTFSDGTVVPAGAFIAAASTPDPCAAFDGFRFAACRADDGAATKHNMVTTSADYLPFGHGRHAWCVRRRRQGMCVLTARAHSPGRFFAANELKGMLAHLVLTYDVKLEDARARPADLWVAANRVPNTTARVLFRRRRAAA